MHSANPISTLTGLLQFLPEAAPLWVVDVPRQRILSFENGSFIEAQPVSTSRLGLGNIPDSLRTPPGWHRVTELIGQGCPAGQRFVSRRATGEILTDWRGGEGDAILSRVLPLRGLEPGINDNSLTRHIYLHGTNQEEKLGNPASHGCIRMGNESIIRWADRLNGLPYVWIGSLGPHSPSPDAEEVLSGSVKM